MVRDSWETGAVHRFWRDIVKASTEFSDITQMSAFANRAKGQYGRKMPAHRLHRWRRVSFRGKETWHAGPCRSRMTSRCQAWMSRISRSLRFFA
jgi:hypothetical protein